MVDGCFKCVHGLGWGAETSFMSEVASYLMTCHFNLELNVENVGAEKLDVDCDDHTTLFVIVVCEVVPAFCCMSRGLGVRFSWQILCLQFAACEISLLQLI